MAATDSVGLKVTARWAEWNGAEFAPEAEVLTLEARHTPKMLHVTLPSGHILRFKRFDRTGNAMTRWRSYYGGSTTPRKYIHIEMA